MDGFCFELMEWLEVISVALLAAFVLTTIVFVVGFFLLFACLQDQMDEEEDLFRGLMWTLPVLLLCSCAPHRDYTKVVIEDSLRIERLVAHPIEARKSSLEAWMECDERGRVLLSRIEELEDDKLSLSLSLDSLGRMLVKASTPPDTVWLKADSVVIYRREEVPVPVERQLTRWEAARMRLGDILLVIVNIGLIYVVIWLIRRRKR